ncbi:MAG: 16S rRNA (cytidine(1402)-2'-O)-methyltransferase [Proteobacteria bacterium]|nr:16S rRNA (cytidine(1402)-2'-O)-methyltransferase [Pseudomonadota bacterium]MBI3498731.1 16S rRNA (cytidine(1402)-2'-O)-methyltransferase [Pseudomonadota bacterium]
MGGGDPHVGPLFAAPTPKSTPGLYLVATPIGNAEDISLRALRVFAHADVVACEDTRVTGRLFAMHGISVPLTAYHEHNAERQRPHLLARLARGEVVALASDAGTPLISDPGYKLVREAIAAGHTVTVLPGASAPLAALLLSGLPTDRFCFLGFLPAKSAQRRKAVAAVAAFPGTILLFESPHRLAASLDDLATILGDRPAAVARELTKLYEEVRRDRLVELARHYAQAGAPKGEIVVVIGGPEAKPSEAEPAALDRRLAAALETLSIRDAAAQVAGELGLPRREVYARALTVAKRNEGGR